MQLGIAAALDQAAQFAGVFGERRARPAGSAGCRRGCGPPAVPLGLKMPDMTLAFIQLTIGFQADLLQAGQADVHAHHANDRCRRVPAGRRCWSSAFVCPPTSS